MKAATHGAKLISLGVFWGETGFPPGERVINKRTRTVKAQPPLNERKSR
ncbi:hypothetical protein M3196_14560 [Fictibacillus nanhaiensis]|nr:hypothetical protein [Fictibacillus nanhaiensis]MCM3732872.1 hypothetical protein [Fictibacillus nanhaiensis]